MDELNDFLSRVNSCLHLRHSYVKVRLTKFNLNLVKLLESNGYIKSYTLKAPFIIIFFRYVGNRSSFRMIKLVSKKSKRIFINKKNINILNLKYPHVVSTSEGLFLVGEYYNIDKFGEVIFKLVT